MFPTTSGGSSFTVALSDEQATHKLVVDIAAALLPGDLIALSGDLGAGKTTFARALIRHLAGDAATEVPSPSFTLMQFYELPRFAVAHADLFRLSGPTELAELGFDDIPENALVLVEWPDRAAGYLPADRLDVTLTLAPQQSSTFRNARITGYGSFAPRAERIHHIRRFLATAGFASAERRALPGDASARSYERLTLGGRNFLLMNSPRRPDGPPVRDGKPYSVIAHLAEDVTPFIAMARALNVRGLSAPAILHGDRAAGLLIIEDLGNELVVAGDPPAPIEERYQAAVGALVALHRAPVPASVPVEPDLDYTLPRYDIEALLIEAELLIDWYLPKLGRPVSQDKRDSYRALWRDALSPALGGPVTWVLRDYHSPNLLWLPAREGVAKVGLLDFQDAVMGHPAYDLASLLQDARVDVPEIMEIAMLSHYTRARREIDPAFDAPAFARVYATLAAQRASKILGIFARLEMRDGKPQYLRHLPRVWAYLQRSLAHPALATLRAWYNLHVADIKT
ncbi:MAG: tRNA (adenosine(37)-N6)-threonylcarbamoyltransferase complex ATPase subunit type 1 TsaE [Pseudolabrys sp.]